MKWLRSREGWTSPVGLMLAVGFALMAILGVCVLQGLGQAREFGSASRVATEMVMGSVFSPMSISDSIVWLYGDAGVTADGSGKVSAWSDQISVGNNGAQGALGNQPLLIRPTSGITIFAVTKPSGMAVGDVVAKPLTRLGRAAPKYRYPLSYQADNVAYGNASTTPVSARTVESVGSVASDKRACAPALVYNGATLEVLNK